MHLIFPLISIISALNFRRSPKAYLQRLKELADALTASVAPIDDADLVYHTLHGLPDEFEPLLTLLKCVLIHASCLEEALAIFCFVLSIYSLCFTPKLQSLASWVLLPVAPVTGRCLVAPVRAQRSSSVCVRSSLDTNVSDMGVNAPKGLFPAEPEHYRGPKLKVAIIGAGLAGMSKAFELLDQCHEVDIYESRPFIGGKVGSYVDKR
ncbi:unnamed protein product [Prunus armeniaca]|uniref:Amine oxidase domain-containing protein n=2 Tax=Prunus armeniaca TaxID=36596 RepID=A0A6J5ULI4_PRUAR|nr:unnamed protein product [Prunus armeniaca]